MAKQKAADGEIVQVPASASRRWQKHIVGDKDLNLGHGEAWEDLEPYPNLREILCGYVDDSGTVVEGGSIVMFVGNQGRVSICLCPKGVDQNFYTDVDDVEHVFNVLEHKLLAGKGSWRPRKKGKSV